MYTQDIGLTLERLRISAEPGAVPTPPPSTSPNPFEFRDKDAADDSLDVNGTDLPSLEVQSLNLEGNDKMFLAIQSSVQFAKPILFIWACSLISLGLFLHFLRSLLCPCPHPRPRRPFSRRHPREPEQAPLYLVFSQPLFRNQCVVFYFDEIWSPFSCACNLFKKFSCVCRIHSTYVYLRVHAIYLGIHSWGRLETDPETFPNS